MKKINRDILIVLGEMVLFAAILLAFSGNRPTVTPRRESVLDIPTFETGRIGSQQE